MRDQLEKRELCLQFFAVVLHTDWLNFDFFFLSLILDYIYSEDAVVISDNLVSSRGPATSLAFSLAIVEILAGKAKRDEVALPLMMADSTI